MSGLCCWFWYWCCLGLVVQVAACQGSEGDATPFTEVKVDDISEELHKRGYQRYGWEVRARDAAAWVVCALCSIGCAEFC